MSGDPYVCPHGVVSMPRCYICDPLAATPAPLDVLVAARAVVDAWEETVTATVISRTNWAIERLRYALAAALDEEPS